MNLGSERQAREEALRGEQLTSDQVWSKLVQWG